MRLDAAIDLRATAEAVFVVLSDPLRLPEWNASIVSARRIDEEPIGLHSRAVFAGRFMGQSLESETEVIAFDPPRLFATRAIRGPKVHTQFTLEPQGDVVRLTVRLSGDVPGGVLGGMVAERLLGADLQRSLERLRSLCETA